MSEKPSYIFNVRASLPDNRDYSFKQDGSVVRDIVDLREFDSPVEDQGNLGSCVSHAVTAAYENLLNQKYPSKFSELSRLYNYYHTRFIEGTTTGDYGVLQIRNALKSLQKYCICAEVFWPYNIYKYKVQPNPNAYADAPQRTIMSYAGLKNTMDIIDAINNNYPVVVGLNVFESFMSLNSSNPIVQMPGPMEYSWGGHAMSLVGYSTPEKRFIAKNSFGQDWGANGYCWIPFEYTDAYVFDRWIFDVNNQQLTYEV